MNMEKTDLKKILAISGEHGLYSYIAQARAGMIAESLETKVRKTFGASAKVTSLGDISIYTTTDEKPLKEVLEAMAAKLDNGEAISPKEDQKKIKAFFDDVMPDYDADRFYVSHMKKVLAWYNELQKFASLDFVEDEEPQQESAE